MTSFESYQMCPAGELEKHLEVIDKQCEQALDVYKSLLAQRTVVLKALGVTAIDSQIDAA